MGRIVTTWNDSLSRFTDRFPDRKVSVDTISDSLRYLVYTAPCGCERRQREQFGRHPISGWDMWLTTGDGQTYECDQHCAQDQDK